MQENFQIALRLIAQSEGGFSNHPDDPGGATMRGVTLKNYQAYCKRKGKAVPGVEALKRITLEEVAEIFRLDYWNRVRGDALPAGVDYACADYAFNSGAAQASKDLQRVIKALGFDPGLIDAKIGTGTLSALQTAITRLGEDRIINAYLDRRWQFMQSLRNFSSFKNGWKRRIDEVRAKSLQLAHGDQAFRQAPAAAPDVTTAPTPIAKATAAEANVTAIPGVKSAATTIIGSVGAAATAGAQQVLSDSSYQGPRYLIYGVLAFLVLSIVAGVFAYLYARNKPAEDGTL